MHFYRIVGAILVAFSGVWAAMTVNSGLLRALKQTEALISFLVFVRSQVECFSLPASDIISSCDREILRECGYSSDALPTRMWELVERLCISDGETEAIVRKFAYSFGQSYRDEQLRECDYYIELLRERRRAISEALPLKKRVNSTLCISSALALIILLI